MSISFINAMKVPEDQESRFLELWDKGAQYVAEQPGFLSTSLHRNVHRGEFQYYTIANWADEPSFRNATSGKWWKAFTEEFGFGNEETGLVASPAVCDIVRDAQARFS